MGVLWQGQAQVHGPEQLADGETMEVQEWRRGLEGQWVADHGQMEQAWADGAARTVWMRLEMYASGLCVEACAHMTK